MLAFEACAWLILTPKPETLKSMLAISRIVREALQLELRACGSPVASQLHVVNHLDITSLNAV